MKKSEIKILAILLGVVLVLTGTLLLQNIVENKEEPLPYLFNLTGDIAKIDFANGKEYVHLEKSGGVWEMADAPSFEVDSNAADMLAGALKAARVTDTISIEKTSQLSEYSLLSPQCVIEFQSTDGQSHSARVGTLSTLTDEIYMVVDENLRTVFVTTPEIGQAFSCSKLDLLQFPAIPTPETGHREVVVQNRNGEVKLIRDGEKWYVETGDSKVEIEDKTAYNYYYLTWDMHWRGKVEYNAKDLSKYDLTNPRIVYSLKYEDGSEVKEFCLELGSSLPDGYCYAKLKDSNNIFLLDSLMADWLETTKEENLYELQK